MHAEDLHSPDVALTGDHGLIACGGRQAHPYDDRRFLACACLHQVLAQSTGRPLAPVDATLVRRVGEQTRGERLPSELSFEVLRRTL